MNRDEKASISVLKIVLICIVLIFAFNVVTKATNVEIKNTKIVLSNNYELDVVTTKEKVSEVLKENHIVILPDEKVTPDLETVVSNNEVITISKINDEKPTSAIELAEEDSEVSMDQVLSNYTSIVEKIVVEEVVIPYETITKDVSNSSKDTANKVIQEGKDGLKKISYKVKYQNDVEIEKIKISEEIVKKPVDKIVQVQAKTTSRSSSTAGTRSKVTAGKTIANIGTYKVTAYCACSKCCGKSTGITASGKKATAGRTIAAPSNFAFGTKLKIGDNVYVVEDRGGAIKGNRIDIFMDSHSAALQWGSRYMTVEVVE